MSSIEWTAETWNPLVGCSIHTPGCTNCYAMKMAGRLEAMARIGYQEMQHYEGTTSASKNGFVWTGQVNRAPDSTWLKPLRWKRPRRIFVNSMSDVFHESVPDEWIDEIFAIMALCPQHTFQLLTKRADRMREYLTLKDNERNRPTVGFSLGVGGRVWEEAYRQAVAFGDEARFTEALRQRGMVTEELPWPLTNVWLGVSVEDQKRADARIPDLLESPAAVRWLSMEPLLGPVDLGEWFFCPTSRDESPVMDPTTGAYECCSRCDYTGIRQDIPSIDWVVVGGESGPGARPMHPDWPRQLRDACAAAGVPFFVKQLSVPGRRKVLKDIDQFPADLRIREYPVA